MRLTQLISNSLLAQDGEPGISLNLIAVVLISLVVIALAFALILKLRKRLLETQEAKPATGFTLADLKQMHVDGMLSDQEYERARARLAERARKEHDLDNMRGPAERGPGRMMSEDVQDDELADFDVQDDEPAGGSPDDPADPRSPQSPDNR